MSDKDGMVEALRAGGRIWYAGVTGGLVMFTKDGLESEARITMRAFLDLRHDGVIEMVDSMRQGHSLFNGRCECYMLTQGGDLRTNTMAS